MTLEQYIETLEKPNFQIESEDALYLLGVLHWYDWWNGDRIEYDFEVIR